MSPLADYPGVGWRRELAVWIDRRPRMRFLEVMAEDFSPSRPLPPSILGLLERGVTVVPHSVSLSLGSGEPPDKGRIEALGQIGKRLGAPIVSDHIAFVRSGTLDSGHLLPPPRTQEVLDILVENVRSAQRILRVPFALENVATLLEWPGAEMSEATFVSELLRRTGALLLLDVSNLYANGRNHGWSPVSFLDEVPLNRLAYVHIAGGAEFNGLYHDTHAHPVPRGPLEVFSELCERTSPPAVILERDDRFPPLRELEEELATIESHISRGANGRECPHA